MVYYDSDGQGKCKNSTENQTDKTPTGIVASGNNPNGYSVGDVDKHGMLSPSVNRAEGNHNIASEGRVQSHHIIQDKWAEKNVPEYKREDATAVLLETGTGKPHTLITNSQRERRSHVGYSTSIQEESNYSYKDLINAGVDEKTAQKAIKDAYK